MPVGEISRVLRDVFDHSVPTTLLALRRPICLFRFDLADPLLSVQTVPVECGLFHSFISKDARSETRDQRQSSPSGPLTCVTLAFVWGPCSRVPRRPRTEGWHGQAMLFKFLTPNPDFGFRFCQLVTPRAVIVGGSGDLA